MDEIMGDDLLNFFGPVEDKMQGIIKVIGVGGGGCNAVKNMYDEGVQGVTFAVCNTDSQSLSRSPVPVKIMLGDSGLGAGANPELGRQEAENNAEDIDLSWRALASGAKLMYCPEPIIYAHGVTSLKDIKQKSFRNGISSSKLQKRYGGRINFDKNIYKMWAHEFPNLFKSDPMKKLAINELTWHLLGKYYGSIKYHVFNI